MEIELSDEERRLIHEALRGHADLMYDMGAEEELALTEELLERFEP
jgi:hypothetical protein